MDKWAMYIGYLTGTIVALGAFLKVLNRFIKALPVTANCIRDLFHKEGWKIKRKMRLP
jgi:hypothetical protein